MIKLNLPIKYTANFITDESYWKRAANARWKVNNVHGHGNSYR